MRRNFYLVATLLLISILPCQVTAQEPSNENPDAPPSFDGLAPGNYIAPDFEDKAPKFIAIVYVEDARDSKEEHPNLREHFARGLMVGLTQRKYRKTASIKDVQERLADAGLSATAIDNPPTSDACRILGVDALMRVRLRDRAEKEMIVAKGIAVFAQATLQDCGSQEVIWSYDGIISGSVGFIAARSNYVIAETLATWLSEKIPRRPKKK